jgi:hypothetical protein
MLVRRADGNLNRERRGKRTEVSDWRGVVDPLVGSLLAGNPTANLPLLPT